MAKVLQRVVANIIPKNEYRFQNSTEDKFSIFIIDSNPTGMKAAIGSIAIWNDNGVARYYRKIGAGNSDWQVDDASIGNTSPEAFNEYFVNANAPGGNTPIARIYTNIADAVAAAEANPDCSNGYTIRINHIDNDVYSWDGSGHTGTRPLMIYSVGGYAKTLNLESGFQFGAGSQAVAFFGLEVNIQSEINTTSVIALTNCVLTNFSKHDVNIGFLAAINSRIYSPQLKSTYGFDLLDCIIYVRKDAVTCFEAVDLSSGSSDFVSCSFSLDAMVGGSYLTLFSSIANHNFTLTNSKIYFDNTTGNNYVYTLTSGLATIVPKGKIDIVGNDAGGVTYNLGNWSSYIGVEWSGKSPRTVSTTSTINPLFDRLIYVDNTSSSVTLNLPKAEYVGSEFEFKIITLGPVHINDVIISPFLNDTIDNLFINEDYLLSSFYDGKCEVSIISNSINSWKTKSTSKKFPFDSKKLINWIEADYGVLSNNLSEVLKVMDKSGNNTDYVSIAGIRPIITTSNNLDAIIATAGQVLKTENASSQFAVDDGGITVYAIGSSASPPGFGVPSGVIVGAYDPPNYSWFLSYGQDFAGGALPYFEGGMFGFSNAVLAQKYDIPTYPNDGRVQLLVGRIKGPRSSPTIYGQRDMFYQEQASAMAFPPPQPTFLWMGTYGSTWSGAGATFHAQLVFKEYIEPGSAKDLQVLNYLSKWLPSLGTGGSREINSATLSKDFDGILTVDNSGGSTLTIPDPRIVPVHRIYSIYPSVEITEASNDIEIVPSVGLINGSSSFFISSISIGKPIVEITSNGEEWIVLTNNINYKFSRTISSTTSLTSKDQIVYINNSSDLEITLPSANSVSAGKEIIIYITKNISLNDVLFKTSGADTILANLPEYRVSYYCDSICNITITSDGISDWFFKNSEEKYPIDVEGLMLWIESDYGLKIADTNRVHKITDRSGNNIHFLSNSGLNPPYLSSLNGKQSILFQTGAYINTDVTTKGSISADGITIYAVAATPDPHDGIQIKNIGSCWNSWILAINDSSSSNACFVVPKTDNSLIKLSLVGDCSDNTPHLITAIVDTDQLKIYGRRDTVLSDKISTDSLNTDVSALLYLGDDLAGSNVHFFAQIIYNYPIEPGSLTDLKVKNYLSKYLNGLLNYGIRTVNTVSVDLWPLSDYIINVDNTSDTTINLPKASTVPAGKIYTIKAKNEITELTDIILHCNDALDTIEGSINDFQLYVDAEIAGKTAIDIFSDGNIGWWIK